MKKLILLFILAGCADDVSSPPPDALPSCEDLGYDGGALLCNSDGSHCIFNGISCQLSP